MAAGMVASAYINAWHAFGGLSFAKQLSEHCQKSILDDVIGGQAARAQPLLTASQAAGRGAGAAARNTWAPEGTP